jgi:hypothetical protein
MLFSSISSFSHIKQQKVLKSFNFKLYYTAGGEDMAYQLLTKAENDLETMENFLGTRLVEQIDIFLSEQFVEEQKVTAQKNGYIFLDNSSVYLTYTGQTQQVMSQLKEQLAEILINGMLFGNTIRERLKNNREINVPNWYVKGLAKFVAGESAPELGWMADYYEGKLNLNLNLTDKKELAEFGHAIFIYVCDSFGVNKLRQLLFYTKLGGETDYAFQFVLNKSLNQVLADWYKLEKTRFLKNYLVRLPNDPEQIGEILKTADILEIKFEKNDKGLDFLIQTNYGIEVWNYSLESKKSKRLLKYMISGNHNKYSFVHRSNRVYLALSNGDFSKIVEIENGIVINTIKLPFHYIHVLSNLGEVDFAVLAQLDYKTDVYKLDFSQPNSYSNLTNSIEEEIDFVFYQDSILYTSAYNNHQYVIQNIPASKQIFSSDIPNIELNNYKDGYLSFVQKNRLTNFGMILNPNDTSEYFQVTNYNRSIQLYDYNQQTNEVMEALKYGKKNYIVISDASKDKVIYNVNFINQNKQDSSRAIEDTVKVETFSYKFITGFEYKQNRKIVSPVELKSDNKVKLKIKQIEVPANEFKPSYVKFSFSNTTFNSPLFASFYPINQGLYNGPNVVIGSGIIDIKRRYVLSGNIRQPLSGRGTDLDFNAKIKRKNSVIGFNLFNSIYQKEVYNQLNKFKISEVMIFGQFKSHPKITLIFQTGFRQDALVPLSVSIENLQKKVKLLQQPFLLTTYDWNYFLKNKLNYQQKLQTVFTTQIFKPLGVNGYNTNLFFKFKHDQMIYRRFQISSQVFYYGSIGKQKTVWLMGGMANWLRPEFGSAPVYNTKNIGMFSAITDFAGLPYNFKAGTSAAVGKIVLKVPINPLVSQQNFNQNVLKYLTFRTSGNLGTAWFGKNPFSISNPDNKEIIETGSLTINNYVAKNPMVWSWVVGANTLLFGYEIGFDYSVGYNERGIIGKFSYLTIGKEF